MVKKSFRFKFLGCCLLYSLMLSLTAKSDESEKSPNKLSLRSATAMKIHFEIEGAPIYFTANLENSAAAQDLIKQLPLMLEFTDHAGTEKIAYPPQKLSSQDSSNQYAGKAGDITYYAPWGNLAIFYKDSKVGYAKGLIYLGKFNALPDFMKKHKKLKLRITQVK